MELKLEKMNTGWNAFEHWEFRYWDGEYTKFKDAPDDLKLKMGMRGDAMPWTLLLSTFVFFAESVYGYKFSKEKLIDWAENHPEDYEVFPAFYSEDE